MERKTYVHVVYILNVSLTVLSILSDTFMFQHEKIDMIRHMYLDQATLGSVDSAPIGDERVS